MALERPDYLAADRVPELDCVIITPRHNSLPVRAETHTTNFTRMPIQRYVAAQETAIAISPLKVISVPPWNLVQQNLCFINSIFIPPRIGQLKLCSGFRFRCAFSFIVCPPGFRIRSLA